MAKRPENYESSSEQELTKVKEQFDAFDSSIKDLTLDRMNAAPKAEVGPSEISQAELARSTDVYLKPIKTVSTNQKFNENFRKDYDHDKEYVQFEANNTEIIGEDIEIWTRPYGGLPAEFWRVPVNKPVWGPRYLANQIERKSYHRLKMENKVVAANSVGQMYGAIAIDETIPRLTAKPVIKRKSVFFGTGSF